MKEPTDLRILQLMIEKTERLISICKDHTDEEIMSNYILSDAIQYEFEKLYEDSTRLSNIFRMTHPNLPVDELRSIRNRIAHNYESVSMRILLNTIRDDIPELKKTLEGLLNSP